MYSYLHEVHILSKESDPRHINFNELVKSKIPAFSGIKARNNELMLGYVALNGPSLPYGIFKDLKEQGFYEDWQYPTVYRRIKDLKRKGYLCEAGKRPTRRGKQTEETLYGLTWRGFLASLSMKNAREKALVVVKRNPLLNTSGVSPDIQEPVLSILQELIMPQELDVILKSFLTALLKVIPNLEVKGPLWIWIFQINENPFPEGFKLKKVPENLYELLDRPEIFSIITNRIIPVVVPFVRQKTNELKSMYNIFQELNAFIEYFSKLDVENQPSGKIREYLESKSNFFLEEENGGG